MVKRFDVFLCETKSLSRPCVVVSPDEMNNTLTYTTVAPITTVERIFPTRVGVRLKGKQAQVALDMIRTIPQRVLKEKIGTLPEGTRLEILRILKKMFSV